MSKENLAVRFREERLRLGVSHAQAGEICGVSRNSVLAWEQGAKIPADALTALMSVGFDPMYILTGHRSCNTLPPREAALVDNYRATDERGRRIIEQTASVAAESLDMKQEKKAG
jgi:transcriptional regulator with XRE-family HTH domain